MRRSHEFSLAFASLTVVAGCSTSGSVAQVDAAAEASGADSGDATTPSDAPVVGDAPIVDAPPLSASKLTAWANEGGDKVSQDEQRASSPSAGKKTTNSAWDGTTITLSAAQNEVVSFNLVLEAPTEDVAEVAVTIGTLTGPGGATIPSKTATGDALFDFRDRNVELFYVRYLAVKGLSAFGYENYYDERHVPTRLRRPWTGNGVADPKSGWSDRPDHDKLYPDIAVPLELVPTFPITKGQNQSIWGDVYVPKGTAAGVYTARVTVSEGGKATHSIPVALTVRKFALPDAPSAKTMLFRGNDSNTRYFPKGGPSDADATKLRDRHFILAHRHKISMIDGDDAATADQPSADWVRRLDGSLFTAANGYAGPGEGVGNGVYSIGTYGGWSWQDSEPDMRKHADAWATWFSAHAPDAEYFLYLIDEPPASKFAQIEQWATWIHNNPGPGKALKSFATVSLLNAQASMPDLDIVASAEYVGDPDLWLPAAAACAANPAKRFWMYNGERP